MNPIEETEVFVRKAFYNNPHHSFGDGSVIYEHSVRVKEFAMQIGGQVGANVQLVALGGLLHDIGKTYLADEETLHKRHEELNVVVADTLLTSLNLPNTESEKLRRLISHTDHSIEMEVIEDADALAFFSDKRLYMLFIDWAVKTNHLTTIKRHKEKYAHLHFPLSRELGRSAFIQMEKDWEDYHEQRKRSREDQTKPVL